jgi:outer membrane lipoprotein carrier protein
VRPLCLFLLLVNTPWPQSPAGSENPSAVARAVEARYNSARTLSAVFLEKYSENRTAVRVESGKVYFGKGGRMRWEYESPEEKLFLADGKLVWFYVPADRTVTRAKLKESADWRTPLALLVGKAKFSRFCGRIELAKEQVSAPGNVALRCLPKGKDAAFHELLFEVDGEFRLGRVVIREPGGIETEFRFAAWQENLPLAEEKFRFLVPVGVAIVEESSISPPM